jgi:hypothetical protein
LGLVQPLPLAATGTRGRACAERAIALITRHEEGTATAIPGRWA